MIEDQKICLSSSANITFVSIAQPKFIALIKEQTLLCAKSVSRRLPLTKTQLPIWRKFNKLNEFLMKVGKQTQIITNHQNQNVTKAKNTKKILPIILKARTIWIAEDPSDNRSNAWLMTSRFYIFVLTAKHPTFVHSAFLQLNMQTTKFQPLKKLQPSSKKDLMRKFEKKKLCTKS